MVDKLHFEQRGRTRVDVEVHFYKADKQPVTCEKRVLLSSLAHTR